MKNKICCESKSKNNVKKYCRTLIAKIPLAKPLGVFCMNNQDNRKPSLIVSFMIAGDDLLLIIKTRHYGEEYEMLLGISIDDLIKKFELHIGSPTKSLGLNFCTDAWARAF